MGKRLQLRPHLTRNELGQRKWRAKEPHERSWWPSAQTLWLLAKGHMAAEVAESMG